MMIVGKEELIEFGFEEEEKSWFEGEKFKTGKLLLKGWIPTPTVQLEDYHAMPTIMIGGMQCKIPNREALRKFREIILPRFCEKA